MKMLLDVHTHSLASGHAYSTLQENIEAAREKGLQIYGISDHAPAMPGSAYIFHFQNLHVLPRYVGDMRILRGAELNILSAKGQVDISDANMEVLDYAVASLHPPCFNSGSKKDSTRAIIHAMEHKKVKVIGHPDDSRYPLDYDEVVRAAKELGVLLEVNNGSLNPSGFRVNAKENIMTILELSDKYNVPVICNSDAHISYDVGEFNFCLPVLEEAGFPEDLVINTNPEKFLAYLGL